MSERSGGVSTCPHCGTPSMGGELTVDNCPRCLFALGQDDTLDLEPDADEVIGRYRLVEPLGRGGMGVVYLAEQSEPIRRQVALKLIKLGMDTREVLTRFEAERQTLAILDHPNIARVYDAGATDRGRPYFVMQRIDGPPLTAYAELEGLDTRQRVKLFLPVCDAIEHAHRKGILHRDVKPTNVLVATVDGVPQPKVIDFGVARAMDPIAGAGVRPTVEGRVLGTPEYMSPEQLGGGDVDTRSDVYSLGVVLYELLVGALPFDPGTPRISSEELRRRILQETPPLPSTTGDAPRRELRRDLDWIVMKAIDRDPERRYATPRELALDLRRFLRDEPVVAGPPSVAYRAGKFVRRHTIAVLVASVLVVGLFAGAVIASVGLVRARRAEEQSRRVSEFLAEMLAGVEPARAGRGLLDDVRDRVAEVHRSAGESEVEIAAARAALDDALFAVNMTDVGLGVIETEIFERATTAIDERFAGEPEIAGRLHHTVGKTCDELGLYTASERNLRRAVELRTAALGADHLDTLDSRVTLGGTLVHLGRLQEAETIARETLARRRTLAALNLLGLALAELGHFDEAEEHLVAAVGQGTRLYGVEHGETLRAMNDLGHVYFGQGRFNEAERVVRESIEIYTRMFGPEHADTLVRKGNLAILLNRQKKYEEAEALYLETIEALERVVGAGHLETLRARGNLASLYGRLRRLEDAGEMFRKNLELQERALGPGHPQTLLTKRNLATVAYFQGKNDEAATLFRDNLETQRRVLGNLHPEVAESLLALASIEVRRGNHGPAIDWLEEAVATGHVGRDKLENDAELAALEHYPTFRALLERADEHSSEQ